MLTTRDNKKDPAVPCNYPDTHHLLEWSVWKIPVYLWNTTHRRHSKSPPPCPHPLPPPPEFSHPSPLTRLLTSPASSPLSCWVTGWRTPGTILMYRQKDGRMDGWLGQRRRICYSTSVLLWYRTSAQSCHHCGSKYIAIACSHFMCSQQLLCTFSIVSPKISRVSFFILALA